MATAEAASFSRPGLLEEYRVSADGVRQDFVVLQRPEGTGELRVTLGVTGARVEQADYGIKLTLPGSGREIGYSRLRVTDATGKKLAATLTKVASDRIAVLVEDTAASYPVRIDPTFSDSDWVGINPGIVGPNGTVYAMAVDGNGNLYVGGYFSMVGTVAASCIAKWDGTTWSALGLGTNFKVQALAVNGSDVYAGGLFSMAGGMPVNNIAKWNGSTWSALGTGVNYTVRALIMKDGILYAGGDFFTAGGISTNGIAQWDGSTWSGLGSGILGGVYAMAVMGGELYVGGDFITAGGVSAMSVAKWNGNAWSALGSGLNAPVSGNSAVVTALVVSGTTLYAAGDFSRSGLRTVGNVAKWNGSSWTSVGGGTFYPVKAMVLSGGDLYVGGDSYPGLSKWDGSSWSDLGTGVADSFSPDPVYAFALIGTDLCIGGDFYVPNVQPYHIGVMKWDGNTWSPLFKGIYGTVKTMAASGSILYAAGIFGVVGGHLGNHVAKWDGQAWTALGGELNGVVNALLVHGGDVYAAGNFTSADGVAANCIAKWDGIAWSPLGAGLGGMDYPSVLSLAMIGTDLYAGGLFTTAGGVSASYIAKWDGSAWNALGAGIGGGEHPSVNSLAMIGTDLYAGGIFSTAGEVSANNIAKWDGSAWCKLGGGFNYYVAALAVNGSILYAAGGYISKWDGSTWSDLPPVPTGSISALAVNGTNLYACGDYYLLLNVPCISKWDGNSWSGFGSGMNFAHESVSPVVYFNAMAVDASNHLFVGGENFRMISNNSISPCVTQANLPTPTPDIAVTQTTVLSDGTGGVDFGPVVAGSGNRALTFTLTNPGDAEISGLSVSIDGVNNADFAASPLSASHFVPGESVTFNVTYAPGALTAGSSAGLHIVSNVGGSKSPFDISLSGMGVTANQGWQQQYFGVITGSGNAAPGADPNHNGIPNLMEYALGGDPAGVSSGSGVLPGSKVDATGNRLQLSFNRYPSRNDITLIVQAADSLAGPWTDLAQSASGGAFSVITSGTSIIENAMGSPRAVSVSDLYQTTDPAHPQRFMRLKVSQ